MCWTVASLISCNLMPMLTKQSNETAVCRCTGSSPRVTPKKAYAICTWKPAGSRSEHTIALPYSPKGHYMVSISIKVLSYVTILWRTFERYATKHPSAPRCAAMYLRCEVPNRNSRQRHARLLTLIVKTVRALAIHTLGLGTFKMAIVKKDLGSTKLNSSGTASS